MERVFLLGGLRSHIGIKNGVFRSLPPERLGAAVLRELLASCPHPPVEEIICGNAAGTGGNIARLMALWADISQEIPASTVDMQCASGLESIRQAFAKLRAGLVSCVVAGGFESSSLQPERHYHPRDPRRTSGDGKYAAAQFCPEELGDRAMLDGAERTAQREGVMRPELDRCALESHRRAAASRGLLAPFICPVGGSVRDEGIRERISQRLLDRLPPVADGRTTAGHSSLFSDGAAFVLLCTSSALERFGLTPRAELLSCCAIGGDPLYSPLCADRAAGALLARSGLSYCDIEAFEYNEAFAVIDVLFARDHPEAVSRYNPLGGALAYGHPYGASGTVLLLHLLASLKGGLGVCAAAAAGGQGNALLVRGTPS